MRQYIHACTGWLIDRKTWKMIKYGDQSRPCEIIVPNWTTGTYGESVTTMQDCVIKDSSLVWFNGFRVKVYKCDDIKITLSVRGQPTGVVIPFSAMRFLHFGPAVFYSWVPDDNARSCILNYDVSTSFGAIPSLDKVTDNTIDPQVIMSYGILPRPLNISFCGSRIRGSRYCLIGGAWAIIFDSGFRFEALVAITGVRNDVLCVSRILYAVSTQLVKLMTLQKELP